MQNPNNFCIFEKENNGVAEYEKQKPIRYFFNAHNETVRTCGFLGVFIYEVMETEIKSILYIYGPQTIPELKALATNQSGINSTINRMVAEGKIYPKNIHGLTYYLLND